MLSPPVHVFCKIQKKFCQVDKELKNLRKLLGFCFPFVSYESINQGIMFLVAMERNPQSPAFIATALVQLYMYVLKVTKAI